MEETSRKAAFDPLDLNNYKVEKLPKMQKSKMEQWMARLGLPLALLSFVFIYWFCHIGFIDNLNVGALTAKAQARMNAIGLDAFLRSNYAMLAIFVASLILWITEAIPNYLTSLLVILGIVLTGVTTQKEALAQLGGSGGDIGLGQHGDAFLLRVQQSHHLAGLALPFNGHILVQIRQIGQGSTLELYAHQPHPQPLYLRHHSEGDHNAAYLYGSVCHLRSI